MNNTGRPLIDYTNKDYASLREAMLALASEKLPEWTDHSPNDLGVVLIELLAAMGDTLAYYQDRIANESYLDTAVERRSVMNLLRLIGYELRPPQPASVDLKLLFDQDATGFVVIPVGAQFQAKGKDATETVSFRYVQNMPLTIDLAKLQIVDYGDKKYRCSILPVTQVDDIIANEVVGSSTGQPGQRFSLARVPLIDGSLEVVVQEGVTPRLWERKDSLLQSLSGDCHYVARRDEDDRAWVEFGDGKYGRIPPAGHNNLIANYRVGGGTKGNVPARSFTMPVEPIELLKHVDNDDPAAGGLDAESISEASERGPQLFRARGRRAVTAADYEAFARQFGVSKVHAHAIAWNQIDMFVAPAGGGIPSDTLKHDLRLYFEDKRMMTTSIEIKDPVYVDVIVEGDLEVEPYYFNEQVRGEVENAVRQWLAFDNVDFGGRLYISKVYEAIEAVPGVRGITVKTFKRSDPPVDVPLPLHGRLEFGDEEIPRLFYAEGIRLGKVGGGRSG